jgi:uncharacterized cupredoxin-like copper-binding protein
MTRTIQAVTAAAFLAIAAGAQAQLTWDKTEAKLNPKPGDKEAVATFTYTNKGKVPVKITSVKSSCGCTVPELQKKELAPGEKGELTATFTIGGRTGTQVKNVMVQTDHPEQPIVSLTLTANIAQALTVQPVFVHWEQGAEAKPKTLTVKAAEGVTVNKLSVSTSSADFKAQAERQKSGDWTITVQPVDTSKQAVAQLTIISDVGQPLAATASVTSKAGAATR